MSTKSVARIFQ